MAYFLVIVKKTRLSCPANVLPPQVIIVRLKELLIFPLTMKKRKILETINTEI